MKPKILCVVGTRPEAIKMAPLILLLRQMGAFDVKVLVTAQHRDLLDDTFLAFGLRGDVDLNVMQENQTLCALTARLLDGFERVLSREKPDVVIAQGDTTTVLVAALASFYFNVPFAHVEAGLRTGNLGHPFPEELNRVLASRMTRLHFAPTKSARDNLLAENVGADRIWVTGNTVIDALFSVDTAHANLPEQILGDDRLILVTCHRRESFGSPFAEISAAILEILDTYPDARVLYPVHPNPNIRQRAHELMGGHRQVILTHPLGYVDFVAAMKRSFLILSDSGGVQEEAPALGKPVLVLRETTERPEAVAEGVVKLVGTERRAIVNEARRLFDDPGHYKRMATGASPYGDGKASQRIAEVLSAFFGCTLRGDGANSCARVL